MSQLALSDDFVRLVSHQAKVAGYASTEAYLRDLVDQYTQVPDGYTEEAWQTIRSRALGPKASDPKERKAWLNQALREARDSMERGERSERTAEQIINDILNTSNSQT